MIIVVRFSDHRGEVYNPSDLENRQQISDHRGEV